MNKSQPIKNKEKLDRFKNFYIEEEYNPRNYMFISLGLNTALRVSDLLKFTWNDVYNFDNGCFRTHVKLTEQKTTKQSVIFLNSRIINSLSWYKSKALIKFLPETFLFSNADNRHISRSPAYRIVHNAAVSCEIEGVISPHSLRKTFGYYAWKLGTSPVLLMDIYQHSSFEITKRYLGIEQDERDSVFRDVVI